MELHKLAASGTPEELKQLLASESGANVEQRDFYGRTPLMIACRHGNYGAVEVLLHAGADLFAEDIFGNHALDHLKSTWREEPENDLRKPATKSENTPQRERPLAGLDDLAKHSASAARGVPVRLPEVETGAAEPLFRNEHTGQELSVSQLIGLYNHYLDYANNDRDIAGAPRFGLSGGSAYRFAWENLPDRYESGWEYFKETQGWQPTQGQAVAVKFGQPPSPSSYLNSDDSDYSSGVDAYDFWDDARELVSQHREANETIRLEIPGVLSFNGSVFYFLDRFLSEVLEVHILEYASELALNAPDEDEEDDWDDEWDDEDDEDEDDEDEEDD